MEIINNMPFDEYLALDRMSSSALKNFMDSPAFYQFRKTNPMKTTDAFKLGTMIHTWILENSKFNNEYMAIPKIDKRTKAGKEAFASYTDNANGRILWPEDDIKKYSVLAPRRDTKNEVTVLFEINGIPCKARFDMLHPNGVEDLKTISSLATIDRDFVKFKYYIQMGFYTIAYKEAFGKWPEFFKFTFVSTGEFLEQITCDVDFDYIEFGRMEVLDYMEKFKACLETDEWPGRSGFSIARPGWL